jgi:H+/Cl- antiporter ClcA
VLAFSFVDPIENRRKQDWNIIETINNDGLGYMEEVYLPANGRGTKIATWFMNVLSRIHVSVCFYSRLRLHFFFVVVSSPAATALFHPSLFRGITLG